MPEKNTDKLATYRAKRSADSTPEPFAGGWPAPGGNLFVVQQHHARARHFDLRLEIDGVLASWAVPKGPSPDPKVKRFAVRTEDHPLEYANFEGQIPEGNYGAGTVIVWDQGQWEPLEDVPAGFEKGKLLFNLHGCKLHGRWTLIKTRRDEKDWLLIKERDRHARSAQTEDYAQDSVLSGLTVEEVAAHYDPAATLAEGLLERGAARRRFDLSAVKPMLATAAEPFDDPGWLFELKYDGYRVLASREDVGQDVVLRSRNGNDLTASFPEVAFALGHLPFSRWLIDGEVVVLDAQGLPSFALLQRRAKLRRARDLVALGAKLPAVLYAFDLLALDDLDLRALSVLERKQALQSMLARRGLVRFADHVPGAGTALFEQTSRMGLEGVVGKRAEAPYESGRSEQWRKIAAQQTADCIILGYSLPEGAQSGFGALLLGQLDGDDVRYVGRVGTGFGGRVRDELWGALRALPDAAAVTLGVPEGSAQGAWQWLESDLVCEVRYKNFSAGSQLRQPVFVRLREDKSRAECVFVPPRDGVVGAAPHHAGAVAATEAAGDDAGDEHAPAVAVTNSAKVFWPDEGYTKGDLIAYHDAVAPWLLAYLRDRPLVLTRFPDGIEGKSFFQKDAPAYAPPWLRRETLWSQHAEREVNYFVADSAAAVRWIINLGTIPLHVWSSRLAQLARPDWSILDLDPKDAPFDDVITIARFLYELCADVGLPCFVKTTGSSGLHILLPMGGQVSYEQSRTLSELLARIAVAALPEIATITRSLERRGKRVYIDYLQNGHGRLLVAPYSVRPLPGAPVSMPLAWREVKRGLDTRRYTIANAMRRLRSLKRDPWEGLLTLRPDLNQILEALAKRWHRHGATAHGDGDNG
ncbi:MAG: DNA ligase D [Pseudomonadota bacterium]